MIRHRCHLPSNNIFEHIALSTSVSPHMASILFFSILGENWAVNTEINFS